MAIKSVTYNGNEFTYKTSDDVRIYFDGITRGHAQRFMEYLMSIGINSWEIKFSPFQGVDRFHYGVIVF